MLNIKDEAQRCLLCIQAPCNDTCPKDLHPARGLRALRFDNTENAGHWLTTACADCDAPCEKACLHTDFPIRIKELAHQINASVETSAVEESSLPSLEIDFCGVHCENPFFLASSAICTNYDMVARAFDMGWGGVVFKTIGTQPMKEVCPRFDETDHWNGFRNMEQISENTPEENFAILKRLKQNYPTKVIVASIMGQTEEEWMDLAKQAEAAGADIIELNFSCPQMRLTNMGSDVGQNPELVAFYTGYVKHVVKIPVLAKMTPNITHISQPALAAYFANADGIAAINTIKSVTMSELSMVNGQRTISGYSGRAIKPIALRHILELVTNPMLQKAQHRMEYSGIGGIETWRDALEYIQLGCANVQICTAVMQFGYRIIEDLTLGLRTYMAENNIQHLRDLVGSEVSSFVRPSDLDRSTMVFPKFKHDKCNGCGRCYIACQDAGHQAIEFGADRQPKLIGTKCVGCHLCRLVCPENAITQALRIPKKE
ncbi:MAG: NAD-dependent dihydropyrimidine dehydrogenase subunit PreA [Paludibacteraceae bacterium]|nr:NAD-dependent dihydropyrimidine dehydrogenase subunit PreA [Paludibacteraceae bacterium]